MGNQGKIKHLLIKDSWFAQLSEKFRNERKQRKDDPKFFFDIFTIAVKVVTTPLFFWHTMHGRGNFLNAKRKTQMAERRTPNAKRQTPNAERRTSNVERRTTNAERRAPSAERRTPNAERRTPNAEFRSAVNHVKHVLSGSVAVV